MTELSTSISSIHLSSCIYNASGPRTTTVEALSKIGLSKSGAILSKSCTLVKQDGNTLPRFVNKIDLGDKFCQGSMNSEGLPNSGVDYYISEEAITALSFYNKPYIISLSGLSLADNVEMLNRVLTIKEIAGVEINLACPNIPNKPNIAYDFEQMDEVLKVLTSQPLAHTKPIGVKLAPYFDIPYYEKAVNIIIKYPISFIVTCNTIGNGLFVDFDKECSVISPKGGYGGLGGGFLKPIALANVNMLFQLLKKANRSDIDIVGVGGVSTGIDAFELILCGAKAVQIGTCHWVEGSGCFERISNELLDIMNKKGYKTIEDFRGKLKLYQTNASITNYQIKSIPKQKNDESINVKNKESPSFNMSLETVLMIQTIIIVLLVLALVSFILT